MNSPRRLYIALVCALTLALGASSGLTQTITHGPVAGGVKSDGARFVVRTTEPAAVFIELSPTDDFNPLFLATTNIVTTSSDNDHFAILDATGLVPDTRFYYRARVNGVISSANPTVTKTQHFTTFPAPGSVSASGPFVFNFGSCQRAGWDPSSNKGHIYQRIARDNARLFIQVGDWGYPDTTEQKTPGDYFNMEMGRVQQSYRSKYQTGYPMDSLFVTTPIAYMYDDHDYAADNSDMMAPSKINSIRGYQAMFPGYPVANADNGNWHKFTAGNAEFFILDTRAQRVPNLSNFEQVGGKFVFNPSATSSMLQGDLAITGEKQMDWLIANLKSSTATWKFVISGTAFNPAQRGVVELALALQGTSFDPVTLPDGTKLPAGYVAINFADTWAGFPNDVARLVKTAHDDAIKNVIFLTGDSHNGAIDDGTHSFFPEIMAGGLDIGNSRTVAIEDLYTVAAWQHGQTAAANNIENAYGRVKIYGEDSCRLELVSESGALIGAYTQMPGHVAASVGMMLAPGGIDFGAATVAAPSYGGVIVINTGGDTLHITNVQATDPQFTPLLNSLTIPPGKTSQLPVQFVPTSAGQHQAGLLITSNVPGGMTVGGLVGTATPSGVEDQSISEGVMLYPNYPNPVGVNGKTMLMFRVKENGHVRLTIVDASGSVIRTVVNGSRLPGTHFEEVSLATLPNGNYFIRLETSGVVKMMKLTLSR